MTVDDLMTRPVVVVPEQTTFSELANLLRRHRISGLPVVDDYGRLLGMVSERDLLGRLIHAEMRRVFADQAPPAASRWESRATGETAAGLMSRPAISTTPEASVDDALELMRRRAVRRLAVIDEDQHVVGIVTRTDLLQPYTRTDQELRDQLLNEVLPRLGVDARTDSPRRRGGERSDRRHAGHPPTRDASPRGDSRHAWRHLRRVPPWCRAPPETDRRRDLKNRVEWHSRLGRVGLRHRLCGTATRPRVRTEEGTRRIMPRHTFTLASSSSRCPIWC